MPRRQTKKTRLIYCEGAQDKTFLDCLKSVYASDVYNVDIKRGTGGDQVHLAEEAVRRGRSYDFKYLKIDGDRDDEEMEKAELYSNENGLIVLKTIPCVERILISILEPSLTMNSWNSRRLKRYFERHYIPENKRTDVRAYKAIFTKELLDEAKGRLPELKELVDIF